MSGVRSQSQVVLGPELRRSWLLRPGPLEPLQTLTRDRHAQRDSCKRQARVFNGHRGSWHSHHHSHQGSGKGQGPERLPLRAQEVGGKEVGSGGGIRRWVQDVGSGGGFRRWSSGAGVVGISAGARGKRKAEPRLGAPAAAGGALGRCGAKHRTGA